MPAEPQNRASGRRWLLAGVAGLYLLSVPWYRDADASPPLWLGLPDWVTVALLCYAGAAVLNSVAWVWTPIEDDAHVDIGGQQHRRAAARRSETKRSELK